MLKIVLMCGGSGGKALQEGFASVFGYGNYKLDAIINAYDDGKSTGVCRDIFNRNILGPSDLRKNQITQFKLKYQKQIENPNSKEHKLLDLFELRISKDDYSSYYEEAIRIINNIDYLEEKQKDNLINLVNYFFYIDKENNILRQGIDKVSFNDFSLSNIFYASCAAINDNSLEKAGEVMAELFSMENNVHLISNVNLYIHATTESGYVITDEGQLVAWNNPDDKVVKVDLVKNDGSKYIPSVNENSKDNIKKLFDEADILIFSSGTQWSSLIPSYMHKGFSELLSSCKAKKYLVMNNAEDNDAKGVNANELMNIISKYIDTTDIKVVLNDNACDGMNTIDNSYKQIHGLLSEKNDKKHNPVSLIKLIMNDYYELSNRDNYKLISDLDGTLWNDKLEKKDICVKNFELFKGIILSGNNYKHVYGIVKDNYRLNNYIYCNYGNTYFKLDNPTEDNVLSMEYLIENDILDELKKYDEFKDKLTIRGQAVLTVRPLQDRPEKLKTINSIIEKIGSRYQAVVAGNTTIDIMKKEFSKATMFKIIASRENLNDYEIIYLGDEYIGGNDTCMLNLNIKNIPVNDVYDTYAFLTVFYNC